MTKNHVGSTYIHVLQPPKLHLRLPSQVQVPAAIGYVKHLRLAGEVTCDQRTL